MANQRLTDTYNALANKIVDLAEVAQLELAAYGEQLTAREGLEIAREVLNVDRAAVTTALMAQLEDRLPGSFFTNADGSRLYGTVKAVHVLSNVLDRVIPCNLSAGLKDKTDDIAADAIVAAMNHSGYKAELKPGLALRPRL
jgi:hypothetical protein